LIKKKFGYSDAEIRRAFAADCPDGQYIKCNIDRHLALILNFDIEFTHQVSIWDYNHQTERGDYHTRKANQWINKLDDLIKAIMKEIHEGESRDQADTLKKILLVPCQFMIHIVFIALLDQH
jgi:hypothetical protein